MEEPVLAQLNMESVPNYGIEAVDRNWREQMVLQYAPMIRYIASRLALRLPSHISLEDLISSGVIGLIDAVQKFDVTKKINFKTYAEFRIKGAMLDELRSLDWIPRSVRKKSHLLENAYDQLQR
ncbi:MAG TPA: sigma-70 family RNA polymerase sigma factor, partial [Desulfobaccales bacterium]|nr:sigma-70 family RNA polymerase sigma factor [Desulfobaccales bacterium]